MVPSVDDAPPDWQPTLRGDGITLRPLAAGDFAALYAAASDPAIWVQHPEPDRHLPAPFARYFAGALASGGALVVVDDADGRIVGSSRFYDWNPGEATVVVGFTFLARSHWGGATNGGMKRLMLAHAFRWARRVCFHVGPVNVRSQRALARIGARLDRVVDVTSQGKTVQRLVFHIDRPVDAGPT
jgi:RimJ/RimL family protein N-acetyltransferase